MEGQTLADRSPVVIPPVNRRSPRPDTLAPDGSEIRFLIAGEHGAVRASMVEVFLPAGGISRPVWHRTVEEIWYILEGQGDVWRAPRDVDAASVTPLTVSAGDALVIPTGWRFQFRAGPRAPLHFLCFTSPPWSGPDEAQPADVGGLGEATV